MYLQTLIMQPFLPVVHSAPPKMFPSGMPHTLMGCVAALVVLTLVIIMHQVAPSLQLRVLDAFPAPRTTTRPLPASDTTSQVDSSGINLKRVTSATLQPSPGHIHTVIHGQVPSRRWHGTRPASRAAVASSAFKSPDMHWFMLGVGSLAGAALLTFYSWRGTSRPKPWALLATTGAQGPKPMTSPKMATTEHSSQHSPVACGRRSAIAGAVGTATGLLGCGAASAQDDLDGTTVVNAILGAYGLPKFKVLPGCGLLAPPEAQGWGFCPTPPPSRVGILCTAPVLRTKSLAG